MVELVIFDCDGVLVDSEIIAARAETALLAQIGIEIDPIEFAGRFAGLYRAVYNKWYVDELYENTVVKPIGALCAFLWKYVDMLIIDGLVNGLAQTCAAAGSGIRRLQGGQIAGYLTTMAVGAVLLIGWVFYF